MKYDEHARHATIMLIRRYAEHERNHLLPDLFPDIPGMKASDLGIFDENCAFCRLEDSIGRIEDREERLEMWAHYVKFTNVIWK